MSAVDYASMDDRALTRAEHAIAKRYMGGVPWLVVGWAFLNLFIWLSLWPLVLLDIMPLWLGFLISIVTGVAGYHPSHEAQHGNMGRPGSRTRWLNELVGHVTTLAAMLPYKIMKVNHMQHHLHVNDHDKDPDSGWRGKNVWAVLWRTIEARQPGTPYGLNRYVRTLIELDTPEAREALWQTQLANFLFHAFLFTMAWNGLAIEAAMLWWLPRHINSTWVIMALNWSPHHPTTERGRYRNTRVYRSPFGIIGSMGIEYHIVHHLHPAIPITRNPAAYRALLPILIARGVQFDGYPGRARPDTVEAARPSAVAA